ncbi:hypothetical protein RZS08_15900, partial [Arthrospira platensis SPKY1]|nr:hypothetical protein [Arthrospira platensis SPKY1]
CPLAHPRCHPPGGRFQAGLAGRLKRRTACPFTVEDAPMNTPSPLPELDIAGLETVYDALATAIDQAGPDKTELFLVKLALLNAQALGDADRFQAQVQAALQDL